MIIDAAVAHPGGNPDSNTLLSDMTTVICLDDYHSLDRFGRKEKVRRRTDAAADSPRPGTAAATLHISHVGCSCVLNLEAGLNVQQARCGTVFSDAVTLQPMKALTQGGLGIGEGVCSVGACVAADGRTPGGDRRM